MNQKGAYAGPKRRRRPPQQRRVLRLNTTVDLELAGRVHRNLMEVNSWMGEAPGGDLHRADGELFFASRSTLPFLNGVMRVGTGGDAADLLSRARSFFFDRGRGFVVFAWPADPDLEAAAVSAGMFPALERYPEMVCRKSLEALGGDLRPVMDAADAQAYWAICDRAYPSLGFPPGLFDEAFTPEELLEHDRVSACVAFEEGRPVACASVWLTAGVAMVGWVAALPEVRGRGLAAACTVNVTNEAIKRGADVVSLQSSPMGEALYRRLGYEELFAYRVLGAMPG
jgi:ribosomal protein S18 acetylase RimI-like enzyme